MKRMILMAAGLAMMLSAAAQPSGERPQMPERPQMKERPSVEQEAQMNTDQMAAELGLDEKQIKKVYKFFKSDIQYRRENFEFGGPRPDGNFPAPPSGGRPGGQGGFPGGGPGGMGPGGFPGGGPGMRPGNPPSGMPAFGGEVDYEKLEKYNAKQDKKLRKIIGDENFEKWRAAHPQELPKMPELELGSAAGGRVSAQSDAPLPSPGLPFVDAVDEEGQDVDADEVDDEGAHGVRLRREMGI